MRVVSDCLPVWSTCDINNTVIWNIFHKLTNKRLYNCCYDSYFGDTDDQTVCNVCINTLQKYKLNTMIALAQ